MNGNSELNEWRAAWKDDGDPGLLRAREVQIIRKKVESQERKLRMYHLLELLMALVMTAGAFAVVSRSRQPDMMVWAVVVWISVLVASGFSLWNWRLLWSAAGKNSSDFIEDYRTHCTSALRAIRFAHGLLFVQMAIAIPWLGFRYWDDKLSGVRLASGLVLLAGASVLFIIFMASYGRRVRGDLSHLEEFRRQAIEHD